MFTSKQLRQRKVPMGVDLSGLANLELSIYLNFMVPVKISISRKHTPSKVSSLEENTVLQIAGCRKEILEFPSADGKGPLRCKCSL